MAGEYAAAKKKDPNLDKYIKQRKGLTKGTPEYNAVQNKINRAYGKGPMRKETTNATPKAAPKNKPLEKPTIKAVKKEVPDAPVSKRSIRETAKNRRKGARYEKRDAMKELRESKRSPKKRSKTVAQGADRADRRAERKGARAQAKTDRRNKRIERIKGRMTKPAAKKAATKLTGKAASVLDSKEKGIMKNGGKVRPMKKRQFPSNKERARIDRGIGDFVRSHGGTQKTVHDIADAGRAKLPNSNAPKPSLKRKK